MRGPGTQGSPHSQVVGVAFSQTASPCLCPPPPQVAGPARLRALWGGRRPGQCPVLPTGTGAVSVLWRGPGQQCPPLQVSPLSSWASGHDTCMVVLPDRHSSRSRRAGAQQDYRLPAWKSRARSSDPGIPAMCELRHSDLSLLVGWGQDFCPLLLPRTGRGTQDSAPPPPAAEPSTEARLGQVQPREVCVECRAGLELPTSRRYHSGRAALTLWDQLRPVGGSGAVLAMVCPTWQRHMQEEHPREPSCVAKVGYWLPGC